MRRAAVSLMALVVVALALPGAAFAHGLSAIEDLPIPRWLFLYAGGAVIVISFFALGALWRTPQLESRPHRALPRPFQRLVNSRAARVTVQSLSAALFVLVLAAALFGDRAPLANIAPTAVWVIFWLGLVPVVVLFGNVWSWLNPWRAIADAAAWLWQRAGWTWDVAAYPASLGRRPAALLLLAFAAMELAYDDPQSPRSLAAAICIYSAIAWVGAAVFGREPWFSNGEAFTVYFGLLARMAPLAVDPSGPASGDPGRTGTAIWRRPLSGLAGNAPWVGAVAFISVVLGTVFFDGLSLTTFYLKRTSFAYEPVEDSRLGVILVSALFIVLVVVLVGALYMAAVRLAERIAESDRPLAPEFILSLVPIALGYTIAHYLTFLLNSGQNIVFLISDPFGKGWNLFGTAGFEPNVPLLRPETGWYLQAAALVIGHILGLMVAHDRALVLFGNTRRALRVQFPLLALMVVYTVGGLWVLSAD